ncbi:hypothetical protein [Saccharopolyspora sp. NPDC002686]|uniref:hypothetical protein n=1 Tax=Saccharopolyspora sp. NPDC002686 TaxID=3154541 RepID=UPI00331D0BC4
MNPPETDYMADTSLTLEDLLVVLRTKGWTLNLWGPRDARELYAATYRRSTSADVIIIRDETDASAYRTPIIGDSSMFCPLVVAYQYHATPEWALRAILALPAPGAPGAPMVIERPHPKCAIPDGLPKPITIRPLSSSARLKNDL